ncbi:SDR family NAD(P)-dependent oxidoreductase [Pendulispora brunnea]|uniref:SDR family NAD(P)-dependent oxidoreductase n=1 Tax=Pendulispora brunnea TaxID=2905690 RepID=A0ABZ2K6Z4_9BACT
MDAFLSPGRAARRLVKRIVNPAGLANDAALHATVRDKVVLVTGASYGLGEATARKLGAAGATVLLVARTSERLANVAAQITAGGGKAQTYAVDLCNDKAVEELVQRILADHGHVDIVVNNAGKSIRRSLHLQYDRFHDFTRTMGVNYLGPARLLLGLLPPMRARGRGHIVNVSTVGVRIVPGPRWGVYQSSKGAFDIWLRSITPEIQADGLTVSTIYMGLIYTRMSAPTPIMRKLPGLHPDEAADLVARAIVHRPREITPWWVWPAEFGSLIARGPLAHGLAFLHRRSRDSESALGIEAPPTHHPRARGRT